MLTESEFQESDQEENRDENWSFPATYERLRGPSKPKSRLGKRRMQGGGHSLGGLNSRQENTDGGSGLSMWRSEEDKTPYNNQLSDWAWRRAPAHTPLQDIINVVSPRPQESVYLSVSQCGDIMKLPSPVDPLQGILEPSQDDSTDHFVTAAGGISTLPYRPPLKNDVKQEDQSAATHRQTSLSHSRNDTSLVCPGFLEPLPVSRTETPLKFVGKTAQTDAGSSLSVKSTDVHPTATGTKTPLKPFARAEIHPQTGATSLKTELPSGTVTPLKSLAISDSEPVLGSLKADVPRTAEKTGGSFTPLGNETRTPLRSFARPSDPVPVPVRLESVSVPGNPSSKTDPAYRCGSHPSSALAAPEPSTTEAKTPLKPFARPQVLAADTAPPSSAGSSSLGIDINRLFGPIPLAAARTPLKPFASHDLRPEVDPVPASSSSLGSSQKNDVASLFGRKPPEPAAGLFSSEPKTPLKPFARSEIQIDRFHPTSESSSLKIEGPYLFGKPSEPATVPQASESKGRSDASARSDPPRPLDDYVFKNMLSLFGSRSSDPPVACGDIKTPHKPSFSGSQQPDEINPFFRPMREAPRTKVATVAPAVNPMLKIGLFNNTNLRSDRQMKANSQESTTDPWRNTERQRSQDGGNHHPPSTHNIFPFLEGPSTSAGNNRQQPACDPFFSARRIEPPPSAAPHAPCPVAGNESPATVVDRDATIVNCREEWKTARPVKSCAPITYQKQLVPSVQEKRPAPEEPSNCLKVNDKVYKAFSVLGRGGSSEVYLVLEPETSKLLAVKCVNLRSVDPTVADGYLNEVDLLSQLQGCSSVITMFDYEYIADTKMLYVVMEKGDVDFSKLMREISKTKELSTSMIIYYWTEMLNAVKEIHDRGIIHSDLKPANFLLVGGRLKLIDFGIASSLQGEMTSVTKNVITGTYNYISPEAIRQPSENAKGGKISYKSDVWSLGCILYNMVYGSTPFGHVTKTWAKLEIIADAEHKVELPELGKDGRPVPGVLRTALRQCLTKNPRQRPTTEQLLQLPYHTEDSPPLKDGNNDELVKQLKGEIKSLTNSNMNLAEEKLRLEKNFQMERLQWKSEKLQFENRIKELNAKLDSVKDNFNMGHYQ